MRAMYLLLLMATWSMSACSQTSNNATDTDIKVGGSCEGCEAIFECPVPFTELNSTDTLPGFESGPKLVVRGRIYKSDGKTPADNVVLYVYHTDQKGVYPTTGTEKGWARRHGYIRGWIRTDKSGDYTIYTTLPASYPNSSNPKHIHPTIKEPGKTAYWIDEFVFADDPLLPETEKNRSRPVGGSGLLHTTMKDGVLYAERNIILGKNVQGYK